MLKTMRQKFQESLGETSGAVEIDVEQLDRFERGTELPSEDILMLLISHFSLQDDEAVKLWELAGYDQSILADDVERPGRQAEEGVEAAARNGGIPVMLLAYDNRVLYSSELEIVGDKAGLVLNYLQPGSNGQMVPVSRIGVSYEQAEQMLAALQRSLLHKKYLSGPKQLPPAASN